MAHISEAPVLQINRFYTGLYTFRNPLVIPVRMMGRRLIELYDAINSGKNMEITNLLTLKRRPGYISYNSNNISGIPLAFYSFKPSSFPGQVFPVTDTSSRVLYTPPGATAPSTLISKTTTQQTNFAGIGPYLYMGNPQFSKKWDGPSGAQGVTNWGIAVTSLNNVNGPNAVQTGANDGMGTWVNPGNITAQDGAFATNSVVGSAGSTVSTPGNLEGTNCGFSIPSTNQITGIQVAVKGKASLGAASYRPTAFATAGSQPYASPANAYDNNLSTSSSGAADSSIATAGETWTTFPAAIGTPTSVTLNVNSSVQIGGGGSVLSQLSYSLDGGATFGGFYGVTSSRAQQTDSVSLPVNQDLTQVQVRGTCSWSGGIGAFAAQSVFEIWIDAPTASSSAGSQVSVQLLKSSSIIGLARTASPSVTNSFMTFGGPADLWGATWTPNDINQTNFGAAIVASVINAAQTVTFSIDFVQITIYGLGGPTVALTTGTLVAQTGYQYQLCYGNSNSGHVSSPTPPSSNVIPSTQGVLVGLFASTDAQVNQIRLFRTTDGGGQPYFELPTSPYPNIGWTFTSVANASAGSTVYTGMPNGASGFSSSVGQTFTVAGFSTGANNGTFACTAVSATTLTLTNAGGVAETHAATGTLQAVDNAPDNTLQIKNICPLPTFNDPPPAGLVDPVWFAGRLWGHVGNVLYFSSGPDITLGNGPEAWFPVYQFALPTTIIRKFPIPNGLLVVTVDDIFAVRGLDTPSFTVNEFMRDIGMRSWNAGDSDGSNVYIYTTDRQMLLLNANGLQSISSSISDVIANVDPSAAYVSTFRYTARNTLLFLGDGTTNIYPYNLNQQAWCPVQIPSAGAQALGSIETQPGIYNFLIGKPSPNQTIAQRSMSTYTDEGSTYACNVVFGPIPFADALTLAQLRDIVVSTAAGQSPVSVSVLANEITGNFQSLQVSSTEPPELSATPSQSFTSNRYSWMTTPLPEYVNFIEMQFSWPAASTADELYLWAIGGSQTTGGSSLGQPGQPPPLQGI